VKRIGLIGNPNSGKSSLFNQLTGVLQKVGNYPGVTVEKKSGTLGSEIELVDLPGVYQLIPETEDEQIASLEIHNKINPLDGVVFILNGMHLEQSLLLFSQIADLQIPMFLIVNFSDKLEKKGVKIDAAKLSKHLGCPVFFSNASSGDGVPAIKEAIENFSFTVPAGFNRSQYDSFSESGDYSNGYQKWMVEQSNQLMDSSDEADKKAIEADILKRQKIISGLLPGAVDFPENTDYLKNTRRIDRVLGHPVWGTVFLLGVLALMFQVLYKVSEWPMELMDNLFGKMSGWTKYALGSGLLSSVIADGIIPGLGGVLIFLPQIMILFFFIAILESSGYMSRIAFLSDRLLSRFGLNGKSVVPLISGVACSIPAIMAARTIKSKKERLLTILVTPFMTCAARLPVYMIIIALVIPSVSYGLFNLQGLVLFGLYMLGTVTALIAAFVISKMLKTESDNTFILEMPTYQWPNWREVVLTMWRKSKSFVVDAGKVIFFISIILWVLTTFSPMSTAKIEQRAMSLHNVTSVDELDDQQLAAAKLEHSFAGILGKVIEPVIKPLGYDWKIGIGLICSFAAREIFVGSMSTIYSVGDDSDASIISAMKSEVVPETGKPRYTLATGLSLLLFYAFAMQCMSTLAIVRKETGSWKWPIIQFIFMTVLAYICALFAFQILK